jgi:hypothetical protein
MPKNALLGFVVTKIGRSVEPTALTSYDCIAPQPRRNNERQ